MKLALTRAVRVVTLSSYCAAACMGSAASSVHRAVHSTASPQAETTSRVAVHVGGVAAMSTDTSTAGVTSHAGLGSTPAERERVLEDRVRAAYYGMMIGDALSSPVHWYYNPRDIASEFGRITDFIKPPARHPSSILSLSNTGGGGRGGQSGTIIGDVILHGKRAAWGVPNGHYHASLAKGENTLNAQVARELVRTMSSLKGYDSKAFLDAYVAFMTTPGTHNDTYAETYHRMFFVNWSKGLPPERCAQDDGHNVASMGGFVMLPPVALYAAGRDIAATGTLSVDAVAAARALTKKHLYLTHPSASLERRAVVYAELLARVLAGQDLRKSVAEAGRQIGVDIPSVVARAAGAADTTVIGGKFSPACYIEDSFPSLLYLAYKYADDPAEALIANTNVGGENCHRGAALGALMGLSGGMRAWPERWMHGLYHSSAIDAEATALAQLVVHGK